MCTGRCAQVLKEGEGIMFKSKRSKDAVRRFGAITLAFLMVFQYTASGLSVYAWAEDDKPEQETPAAEEVVKEEAPEVEPGSGDTGTEDPVADKPEETKKGEPQDEPEEKKEEKPEEPQTKEEETPQQTRGPDGQETDENSDEIQYPAQSFIRTISDVTVRIQAPEGALPEGTEVQITPVKAGTVQKTIQDTTGVEVKVIKAMDITFVDKDGIETEPEEKILVNFEYLKFGSIESPEVYHIDDDGQAEKLPEKNVGVFDDQVSINVQDFSIYAVVEQGIEHDDSRLLVKFVKPDGSADGQPIDDMFVKKGDNMEQVLYDPGVGTLANGVYFKGWTTEENYTNSTTPMTIADIREAATTQLNAGIPEGKTITYYAMLFKRYRITYFDENDISLGEEEVAFRADSTTTQQNYTVNMAYTVQDDTHHFEGWNVKEGGSHIAGHTDGDIYQNNDNITLTGDVQFGVTFSQVRSHQSLTMPT